MKKNKEYYLNLNYPATLETYNEDGNLEYAMEIPDLPGCGASGETIEKAFKRLQEAKELWIEVSLEKQLPIPEPVSEEDFSGKFIVRIPTRLHMELSKKADHERTSLNKYVKNILSEHITNATVTNELKKLEKIINRQSELIIRLQDRIEESNQIMDGLNDSLPVQRFKLWSKPSTAQTKGSIPATWRTAASTFFSDDMYLTVPNVEVINCKTDEDESNYGRH